MRTASRRCAGGVLSAVTIAFTACGSAAPAVSGRVAGVTVAAREPRSAGIGKMVVALTDRRRRIRHRDGTVEPRRLVTILRYPTRSLPVARPLPLVVFAHGFDLTPQSYRSLLHTWTAAGFVTAAPVMPGESATAPGGPDRADLVNEPADLRFVIDRLLAASRRPTSPLHGLIDPRRIAVAGHSDGGDTALGVAYDSRLRSRRIRAAIVLAGAFLPDPGPFVFPQHGPPLLAVQGTADTINPPTDTAAYFEAAHTPKVLLRFRGAGHYGPYTSRGPQLAVLERVSIAFLRQALADGRLHPAALADLLGWSAGAQLVTG